jgi:hypothetical protein
MPLFGRKLVDCRTCGEAVAKTAHKCPHCGCHYPGDDLETRVTRNIGCLFILLIILAVLFPPVRLALVLVMGYLVSVFSN